MNRHGSELSDHCTSDSNDTLHRPSTESDGGESRPPFDPDATWWDRLQGLVDHVEAFFDEGPLRRALWRLGSAMERHSAGRTASAMAFDLFLALIPMLALTGYALTHFIRADSSVFEASSLLADLTPDEPREILRVQFESLSAASLAPLAAMSGWWLASSAFHTMIRVFEETVDCERRPWWKSRLLSLGYALVGMAVLILSGVLGMMLTTPTGILGDLMEQVRAYGLARHLFVLTGLVVMTAFFALLYAAAIKRPGIGRRRVWVGAAVATGLGSGASLLLGYYATRVTRFALFYGGLAAVAILLLWLWLWCAVILLGAEVNVLLEDMASASGSASRKARNSKP